MDGRVPEIFWYLFLVFFVVTGWSMAFWGGRNEHKRRMAALDILKGYAERGAEPPPIMMEKLAEQILEPDKPKAARRQANVKGFIGFLFSACVSGGLTTWAQRQGMETWGIVGFGATNFFAFGAFGLLLAALLIRDK